jgi:hypothetical protein
MSKCAYCGGYCTAHSDEHSHGICDHCLAQVSPNCPASLKHADAMRRGREATARGREEQIARLERMANGELQ